MRKLSNKEMKQVNGGGVWQKVKGGLRDFKNGFVEGLHGW